MAVFKADESFTPGTFIDLHKLKYKLTGKVSSLAAGQTPKIGRDYIPALNCNLMNGTNFKLFSPHDKLLSSALPSSFSWNNGEDVSKYKGDALVDIIMKPGNQLTCGSCYAWAVSTALSDRIGISSGTNPQLGPSYLLSCSMDKNVCGLQADGSSGGDRTMQGCNGGQIAAALVNMSQDAAAIPSSCWTYSWCSDNTQCSSGSGDENFNNTLIPNFSQCTGKCATSGKCSEGSPEYYKVKKDSVSTLQSLDQIKQNIFDKGPAPTGYVVFMDFILATDNWANTDGIYCHLDTDSEGKTPAGDVSPYTYTDAQNLNAQAGAHAVVIVGWGIDSVKNFVPKASKGGDKIDIPYWIVRNSWGEEWGNGGYFKIAMTNPQLYINTTVLFDSASGSLGGVIDFDPEMGSNSNPVVGPPVVVEKSSSNKIWRIILGVGVVLLIISIIWLLKRRYFSSKR